MSPSEHAVRDDVLAQAAKWRDEGRQVALATVVATWASSPRPAGSHLAVDDKDNILGSVSGGCIEAEVVHEAQEVMTNGGTRLLEYAISDQTAWQAGLVCGGRVRVFVELLE